MQQHKSGFRGNLAVARVQTLMQPQKLQNHARLADRKAMNLLFTNSHTHFVHTAGSIANKIYLYLLAIA